MYNECVWCGVTKKSKRGSLCRKCANIKTGKNEERNRKLSAALKGHSFSKESRQKQSVSMKRFYQQGGKTWNQGMVLSDSTKEKISLSLRGEKHPQWKGGRFKSGNGYIWIHAPEHPLASKKSPRGYVLEHRYVMCKMLNRIINRQEIVHHINGVRDDNRPENLMVTTSSAHIAEHNRERIWKDESRQKQSQKTKNMKRNKKGQFASMIPNGTVPFIELNK